MTDKYPNKFEEAKKKMVEARDDTFMRYLEILKETYEKSSESEKITLKNALENIIDSILVNLFKKETAKKCREDLNLKQMELANELGMDESTLCRYENGLGFSSRNPSRKTILVYLNWLKKQGYNLYNI